MDNCSDVHSQTTATSIYQTLEIRLRSESEMITIIMKNEHVPSKTVLCSMLIFRFFFRNDRTCLLLQDAEGKPRITLVLPLYTGELPTPQSGACGSTLRGLVDYYGFQANVM